MWQKDAIYLDFCTLDYISKTHSLLVASLPKIKSFSCTLEPILSCLALMLSMLYDLRLRQSKGSRGKESLFLYSKYCFNKTESLSLSLLIALQQINGGVSPTPL